jgi:hypothetical protein
MSCSRLICRIAFALAAFSPKTVQRVLIDGERSMRISKISGCHGRLNTPPKNSTLPFGFLRTRQSGGLGLSGLAFDFPLGTL